MALAVVLVMLFLLLAAVIYNNHNRDKLKRSEGRASVLANEVSNRDNAIAALHMMIETGTRDQRILRVELELVQIDHRLCHVAAGDIPVDEVKIQVVAPMGSLMDLEGEEAVTYLHGEIDRLNLLLMKLEREREAAQGMVMMFDFRPTNADQPNQP